MMDSSPFLFFRQTPATCAIPVVPWKVRFFNNTEFSLVTGEVAKPPGKFSELDVDEVGLYTRKKAELDIGEVGLQGKK